MSGNYYITTAIEYINAEPHVGHAYEKIGADIIARAMRMLGKKVIFQMGTDEHSTNVFRKAQENGVDPIEFCDDMVEKFTSVWKKLNLSYDVFIRTTSQRHVDTVQKFLQQIYDNGDIYLGKYEGYYCTSCERFYQEKDLSSEDLENKCPIHGIKCELLEEENYFFKLSRYRQPLLEKINENPEFILPKIRKNEIVNFLKAGLDDVSISRSGVSWGVPLPWDKKAITYVWFDALINYISAIGFSDDRKTFDSLWPAQLQIIGKDITRFHCIYWPAMLMSAGIELPRTIFGHGFVHFGGEKMSKTTGTVIDPLDIVDQYGADSLRFYLAKEIQWGQDGDFTWERFVDLYNADLANNLGNMVNRSITMIKRFGGGSVTIPEDPGRDSGKVFDTTLLDQYLNGLQTWRLHDMTKAIISMADGVNLYIDKTEPWALAKDASKTEELQMVLYNLAEAVRWIAICAHPIIPESAGKIWSQLNMMEDIKAASFADLEWGAFPQGVEVKKPKPIFPRIEEIKK